MRNYVLPAIQVISRSINKAVFTAGLTLCLAHTVLAQVTTTQLTVSSPTVAVGVPALLTATVTDAASHSVHQGTVTFYDGSRSLGSAQIVSGTSGAYPQGTANLKTASFGPGANSITAVFAGTKANAAGTSTAKTVTVTGPIKTETTLSGYATGTDFWLPATLHVFGSGAPSGSVDFVHISNDSTIGTKPLSDAIWKSDLELSSTPKVGIRPFGAAAGDFNGDGFLDLAVSRQAQGAHPAGVSVVLGKGDGTFQPQVTYPLAGGSDQIVFPLYAADFNNDGKVDIAVANSDANAVSILLGNGDGTFQPEVEYGSAPNAWDVFIGDLDRDGNLDVAILGSGSVAVLLGKGDGTFQPQQTYPLAFGPIEDNAEDLAGGDLNGDGFPDLVISSSEGVVMLNKGDGTFSAPTVVPGLQGDSLELADLNNDSKLDIAVTGAVGTVSTFLGKGNGTFGPANVLQLPGTGASLSVADLDQDGELDLIVGQYYTGSIEVFPGKGDGTFSPIVNYLPNLSFGFQIIPGDFNGDGRPDLASPYWPSDTVSVVLNAPSTNLLLKKQQLGPGTTTVQALYAGDETFAGSTSNRVVLTPNGTPPPNYPNVYTGGTGFTDTSNLVFNGNAHGGRQVYLVPYLKNQAGSMFYAAPQNVQAFTTDFLFGIGLGPGGNADGLTFTIQNTGPDALGGGGGGLGYKNLKKSVAVKFDLYNNNGEGAQSTGIYVDGASPEVPAVSLAGTEIDLSSASAHITYDGTNLSLTITDSQNGKKFSHVWPIDIPASVGGPTAYVGFTAASGGIVSEVLLDGWTYTPGTP